MAMTAEQVPTVELEETIERLFREDHGRMLATLIRVFGDFDLAEEALQDAFVVAAERWPSEGIPERPDAWVTVTARNRAVDRIRRLKRYREKSEQLMLLTRLEQAGRKEVSPYADDSLRLIFTCCHPSLAPEAQVALTLRTVCGLKTPEVARAFLVSEATIAQRIVRAKRKIKQAAIPYRVPEPGELPERLGAVLATIYLVFNEGYVASEGQQLARHDLCDEAIRLTRQLAKQLAGQDEIEGLLALMLLHSSRREARTGEGGEFVALEVQDRSLWRREEIEEGFGLLKNAPAAGPGPYRVQALISACHAAAPSWDATDWLQIVALYDALAEATPGPVVELNRIVAYSNIAGATTGLRELDRSGLEGKLDGFHPYHAARADLLRRAGKQDEAATAYRRAIDLCGNERERAFLERRLGEL